MAVDSAGMPAEWTTVQLPTKHDLRGAWGDDRGLVVVVGDDGIFRSVDGGLSWAAVPCGVKSYVLAVAGAGEHLFAVTGGGNVLRSADRGASWTKEKAPKIGVLSGVAAAADGRAWAVGDGGLLARDAGTWTIAGQVGLRQVWLARDGTIWACGAKLLMCSRDGARWTPIQGPAERRSGCSAGDAVVLLSRYSVERSDDRGASWTTVTPDGCGSVAHARLAADDDGRIYFGSDEGAILRSPDGGRTWLTLRAGSPNGERTMLDAVWARGDRIVVVRRNDLLVSPPLGVPEVVAPPPAAAALIAGSPDEALLERLLARWRETRSTALADRIDRLSERAAAGLPEVTSETVFGMQEAWLERAAARRSGDLARLVAAFTRAHSRHHIDERLEALVEWPADPRIAKLLAGCFATPQWTGEHAKRFWTQAGELLVTLGDHRALPVLASVEESASAGGRSYLVGWFAKHLPALRERLAATPATELSVAELAEIDAEIAGSAARPTTSASPEALLADIYANPDDDAPRLVYADYLTGIGDPRGELIVLQITGATTVPQKSRVAALLRAHERAWLGAIEPVVLAKGLDFARGFVSVCHVQAKVDQVAQQMIGRREWTTLRAIDVAGWAHASQLELLRHAVMAGVREATGVSVRILDGNSLLPYTRLGLGAGLGSYEDRLGQLIECRRLPHLRALELAGYWGEPGALAKLWKSALGKQLESFGHACYEVGAWFETLAAVPQLAAIALEPSGGHGWSLTCAREGQAFALVARYHGRNKRMLPFDELWTQLEAIAPARVARLAIPAAKTHGYIAGFRNRFADRFPGVELATGDAR